MIRSKKVAGHVRVLHSVPVTVGHSTGPVQSGPWRSGWQLVGRSWVGKGGYTWECKNLKALGYLQNRKPVAGWGGRRKGQGGIWEGTCLLSSVSEHLLTS